MNAMDMRWFRLRMLQLVGFRLWVVVGFGIIKSEFKRQLFCRFGFHQVRPSGEEYHENSRGLMLHTYYLTCPNCNKLFFPTEYQKEQYKQIRESERAIFKNIFKSKDER